ncbi:sodium:calcium antiporter [Candidatus Parcubacteria bacterium]|jgi:cation:H+ antiporter|nr:MAG: sodium:calcium antiporter [Candidatus Parcubacteria bacterium]
MASRPMAEQVPALPRLSAATRPTERLQSFGRVAGRPDPRSNKKVLLNMLTNLFIFCVSLFLVIKGATLATRFAARLAESFRLSKYTIGFIVVAIISILPETFISINAAIQGVPAFGLGMLFGSNIADLTLVFAVIVLLTSRGLKIQSKILKHHSVYPFLLLLPLILGLDGNFSRIDGLALILAGGVFYYISLQNGVDGRKSFDNAENKLKNFFLLLFSMAVLLTGSHFTVTSATSLARSFEVSPVIIGMLIVSLGTTMPEFFFSLRSVKQRADSLAVGDVLGTVLADATIVVGILALLNPFSFPQKIIYSTGVFMVVAAFILFHFMRTGRTLSKRESLMLVAFWIFFVLTEFLINK